MKKFLAILMAALMVFGLVACGDTAATEATSEEVTEATGAETEATEATEAQAATFTTVQEGKLIMATNAAFPPYEFIDDSNNFAGIDVEFAQAIADKLGLELEIQDMEFASILTAVQQGKADIALAGLTVTEERKQNVDFTTTYATGVQVVIVPEGSDIKTVDDLAGKMIGVQESTTGHIYCEDDFGAENVTAIPAGANAVQALLTGKVDAVVIDNNPAKEYVAANEGLVILDTAYAEEDYAGAIAKENPELLAAIDAAIAELQADGTVDTILAKYISAN